MTSRKHWWAGAGRPAGGRGLRVRIGPVLGITKGEIIKIYTKLLQRFAHSYMCGETSLSFYIYHRCLN